MMICGWVSARRCAANAAMFCSSVGPPSPNVGRMVGMENSEDD